jgi:hypothetical protein
LRDVGAWMRNPAPFFIAVDGGAHYGTVPTGLIRLASRLNSLVWPLAIRARFSVRVPGLVAEMPLPRARVAAAIAPPMRFDRSDNIATAAERVRQCLNSLTEGAAAHLKAARTTKTGTVRPQHFHA